MPLAKKQITAIILLLALLFILPVALFVAQKRQEIRPKAQTPQLVSSTLNLVGPSTMKVGERFSVDLVLDTNNDPDFTISSADAVVSVNSLVTKPPDVCPKDSSGQIICPAFAPVPPDFCKGGEIVYPPPDSCGCRPPPSCLMPGQEQSSTATSSSIILVRQPISLINVSPGKIFDNYPVYPGSGIIPGEGCVGENCPRNQITTEINKACTEDAKLCPDGSYVGRIPPRCEFAPCPTGNGRIFTISGVKNYSVDEKGYFKGFTGKAVFATLNFVANYSGKVEISITKGSSIKGYIASQPAKAQSPQERLLTALPSLNIEVVGGPEPTCTPRPACMDAKGEAPPCLPPEPLGGWCPPPITPGGCSLKKLGDANCDGVIDGIDYSGWLNTQCHPAAGQTCADTKADFNKDGKTDDDDYTIWFTNRGELSYKIDEYQT